MTAHEQQLQRVELLLGAEAVARLRQAHVCVIGLGAVGSFAVEALARTGVGHLRLVDFDVVAPSNLNRQLFALTETIGRRKVDVAVERVRAINPDIVIDARPAFFADDTLEDLLAPPLDYIVDAIDSLNPKVALIRAAVEREIPIISSMGAASRTDPTKLQLTDLFKTEGCPLAARVRKRLRRVGIRRGVWAVWSAQPLVRKAVDPATVPSEDGAPAPRGRERHVLPSLCPLPGIFGLTAANHVIMALVDGSSGP
jgi:tRNA threonylcarbamoyladenosine dehydratase